MDKIANGFQGAAPVNIDTCYFKEIRHGFEFKIISTSDQTWSLRNPQGHLFFGVANPFTNQKFLTHIEEYFHGEIFRWMQYAFQDHFKETEEKEQVLLVFVEDYKGSIKLVPTGHDSMWFLYMPDGSRILGHGDFGSVAFGTGSVEALEKQVAEQAVEKLRSEFAEFYKAQREAFAGMYDKSNE